MNVSRKDNPAGVIRDLLADPGKYNRAQFGRGGRAKYLQLALEAALKVLPEGKGKRALAYVVRNRAAEYWFGGTDAVGPALQEAVTILERG